MTDRKIQRYAKRLMSQYDGDRNGYLTAEEWSSMHGIPVQMDQDQNGQIVLAEMVAHIVAYSRSRSIGGGRGSSAWQPVPGTTTASPSSSGTLPESGTDQPPAPGAAPSTAKPFFVPSRLLPANLPSWFSERDQDGDGQLSLAEYAPHGGRDAVASFEQLDTNHDGLLTASECTQPNPTP